MSDKCLVLVRACGNGHGRLRVGLTFPRPARESIARACGRGDGKRLAFNGECRGVALCVGAAVQRIGDGIRNCLPVGGEDLVLMRARRDRGRQLRLCLAFPRPAEKIVSRFCRGVQGDRIVFNGERNGVLPDAVAALDRVIGDGVDDGGPARRQREGVSHLPDFVALIQHVALIPAGKIVARSLGRRQGINGVVRRCQLVIGHCAAVRV